jgi:hypothetical protein
MLLISLTTSSASSVVDGTARAAASDLVPGQSYLFASSASCWIRQGTARTVTCVPKANLVDGDRLTIGVPGSGVKSYAFDVSGRGVGPDRVPVDVSSDTTAAQIATRLAAAIARTQPTLEIANPGDGTLALVLADGIATFAAYVADPGFSIATSVMNVTAGAGSMFVPSGHALMLSGDHGPQVGALQDGTSAGRCSVTRCLRS